ncbi:MAG: SufE family protein [Gemmatimonadales bacterium]|nr:SufE family protein [Gemmatimonadales bacterium]
MTWTFDYVPRVPPTLARYIARFQAADRDTRLESLLDLSRRLPPLPESFAAEAEREAHRVAECQTPVFLWAAREGGVVRLAADVPRESPTVRGFVALLVTTLDGATPAEIAAVPDDLLHELRLDDALGMLRTQGLSAIVRRIKRIANSA